MNYSKLIIKISNKSEQNEIAKLTEFDGFNIRNLMVAAFETNTYSMSSRIMLKTHQKWKNLDLEDVKYVSQSLIHSEIAMIDFLVFCGKYLGIDVREFYSDATKEAIEYVTDYVREESALFYYTKKYDDPELGKFGLAFPDSFAKIKTRLLNEGATKSKAKPPEKLELPDFPPD